MISKIVVLGSGNVAYHLVKALSISNFTILQIFSRNQKTGKELAKLCKSKFTDKISSITKDADAYFFAMNDTANETISSQISISKDKLLLHTAGSLSMNIFKDKTNNYGVFYPFQTFTKNIDCDFSKVPICIEASNTPSLKKIKYIAIQLACKSIEIDEEKRKKLHLAGVFASNFMNHCIYIGENILEKSDIGKELLEPLLKQSFKKTLSVGAKDSQTGPAIRMDHQIIGKHIDLLGEKSTESEIYKIISKSIYKTYNIDNEE